MSTSSTLVLENTPKAKVKALFPWAYTYELKYQLNPNKDWGQFYEAREALIPADKRELFARVKRGDFPDVATLTFEDLRLHGDQGFNHNLVCCASMMKQMHLANHDEKSAASFQGFLDAVYQKIILPRFEEPKPYDYLLQSLLHWAAATGQTEAVKALCKHENPASLNMGDRYGATALHLACQNGHVACAAVLLENGADPNQPQRMKYCAGQTAEINFSQSKTRGEAPLHLAAETGNLALAQLLLAQKNIDVHALDGPEDWPSALNALQIAERTEHHDIAELLRDAGAKLPDPKPEPAPKRSSDAGKEEATSSTSYNPFYQKTEDERRNESHPLPRYNMRPRGQKFLNFLDEFVEEECKHSVGRSKRKYQILLNVITSLKAAEERGEFPMDDHTIRTLMAEAKVHVLSEADRELFHGAECISLMDALKLQRHKTSDKNGHSKTPKSAAKLMHFIDPESMRQHAVEFLEKLLVKLNKTWPYCERADDIRWIETYINGLKRTTHSTIEGLCMFKMKECEHNLLETLSIVGPSRWKAKPYKEFYQWFELDSLAIKKKKPVVEVEEMHPVDAHSTPLNDFN